MKKLLAVALVMASGAAQAALVDRGGGFIYDTEQDITWLQDANYAYTSGYDTSGYDGIPVGRMEQEEAIDWANGLSVYDSVRGVTWDDWRLPTTMQPDQSCSSYYTMEEWMNYDDPDEPAEQGWGNGCTGSEMGHLYNVDGDQLGLFNNLQDANYWSSTPLI